MGLDRIRRRKAKDFIRARVKEMRKKRNRIGKPMEDIGGEKTMGLEGILANDLTTVNKEV